MKAAGIEGELSGRGINWEVTLPNDRAQRAFYKKVLGVGIGGFRTGWGGWVLRPGYTIDCTRDYCDTAARIHY